MQNGLSATTSLHIYTKPVIHGDGEYFYREICYDLFFFGEGVRLGDIGSFTIRHCQTSSGSPLGFLLKVLERIQEPQDHAV